MSNINMYTYRLKKSLSHVQFHPACACAKAPAPDTASGLAHARQANRPRLPGGPLGGPRSGRGCATSGCGYRRGGIQLELCHERHTNAPGGSHCFAVC